MKGKTNNPKGRPKGTPNKTTAEIRENFTLLLDNNIDKMQSDIDQMEPTQRVKILLELAKFVLPTLKAMELNTSNENKGFTPIIIQLENENSNK